VSTKLKFQIEYLPSGIKVKSFEKFSLKWTLWLTKLQTHFTAKFTKSPAKWRWNPFWALAYGKLHMAIRTVNQYLHLWPDACVIN